MKFTLLRVVLTMVLVQSLMGFPIGGLISFFPTIPTIGIFAITILTIPALCYLIFIKFLNKNVPEGQQPNFVQRNKVSIGIGVVLGAILSGFYSLHSLDCDLTVDNGTIKSVKVEYYNRTQNLIKTEIPSGSFQTITLPVGDNTLTINGKKKIIKMGQRGQKYIYNIDGVNNYVLTEIYYGRDTQAPKEKENFFSTEFFKVYADYLFEAPESILTKRRSSEKKIVLLRIKKSEE